MSDSCEICGNRDAVFIVLIQGAKLMACPSCARSGKILHSLNESYDSSGIRQDAYKAPAPRAFREEETVVDDYGSIIRKARNKRGMKREEVANEINEKESFLEHIEKEKTLPPFKVLRKLEKFFDIKLIEKSTPSIADSDTIKPSQKRDLTLADLLEMEQKEKKRREE